MLEHSLLLLILAVIFGFIMLYGIGANDVANAMGTSVGAKTFTLRQAIVVAAIFEFAGATLAGSSVTNTIGKGIANTHYFVHVQQLLIGMVAALAASGTWLLYASRKGWPVSTTHSIIGAIVSFTWIEAGFHAVYWHKVLIIGSSWIISPIIGGLASYLVFKSIWHLILNSNNPFEQAKKYIPLYIFFMGIAISLVTIFRGLKNLHLGLGVINSVVIAIIIGLFSMLLGIKFINKIEYKHADDAKFHFANVEKIFGIMMMFTACSMAFAHGSNDVANAVGPLATILHIFEHPQSFLEYNSVSFSILCFGGLGIVIGLSTYGYKVIQTVGTKITEITPSRGFAAEVATALTVVTASGLGLPISTTHVLVGAILGVGFARGIGALNVAAIRNIMLSWVITLPAGAVLTSIYLLLLQNLLRVISYF